MQLRHTTKMATQAAIAIALAELISRFFYIERGYWITATAMALTAQTWGESVKRSFDRVGMTILGGSLGTLLFFYLPRHEPTVYIFLALVFVFFAIYLLKIYPLISVFFLTCFVVFSFSLLGDWTIYVLQARIIDTVLGAVIALVVGFCFFSSKTSISGLFIDYLQKIKAMMTMTFDKISPQKTSITSPSLLADFQKIKKNSLSIRYELLFHRLNIRDFNFLLNKIAMCTQLEIGLIETYTWIVPHLTKDENEIITVAVATTSHNMDALIKVLQKNKQATILPCTELAGLLKRAIEEDPTRFASLESDALGFFNLIYFFTRLNTCIDEIYQLLYKAY